LGNCNTPVTDDLVIHLQEAVATADRGDGARADGHQHGQEWGRCYEVVTSIGGRAYERGAARLVISAHPPTQRDDGGGRLRPNAAFARPPPMDVPRSGCRAFRIGCRDVLRIVQRPTHNRCTGGGHPPATAPTPVRPPLFPPARGAEQRRRPPFFPVPVPGQSVCFFSLYAPSILCGV